ncbi:dipeptide ABC transporter permease DppC [Salmonella enterica]|nr:dipeptide ABC transporter permease DppC [Salmonella enterica]
MSQVTENNVTAAPAPMTPLREFWHYFKRNKGAVVGLAYVLIVILIAVFANFIAPYNPAEQFRDALLAPPVWQEGGSWAHILGTDDVGRDVLSRLMYGARLSLLVGCLVVVLSLVMGIILGLVGCLVVVLSLVMGIILGLVAGYFGGLVDNIIMRVVDIMLALPSLLLALVLVAIFGPSIGNAALALTFVALPHYVRLTRAAVLVEVNRDYVTASRVAGAGAMRQMFVNIFPNCLAPLIVQASLGFSNAILDMAALGFLGMGAQPPTPEWGTMLSDVLQFAQSAWWVVTFPGLAILLTVLAFNLMGDGLRDALDPKLKQ